jgi:hypothetical protein
MNPGGMDSLKSSSGKGRDPKDMTSDPNKNSKHNLKDKDKEQGKIFQKLCI